MSKVTVITLVIISCILLAIASVALWASLNLFNASRFGAHVAEGLQSPEATQALAVPIVDELLVNNPELRADSNESLQRIIDIGHQVGQRARLEFPQSLLIEVDYSNLSESVEATQTAIEQGAQVLFEAAFEITERSFHGDFVSIPIQKDY